MIKSFKNAVDNFTVYSSAHIVHFHILYRSHSKQVNVVMFLR